MCTRFFSPVFTNYRFIDKCHILRCRKITNYRFRKTGWRFSVGFLPEIEGKNGELDRPIFHSNRKLFAAPLVSLLLLVTRVQTHT